MFDKKYPLKMTQIPDLKFIYVSVENYFWAHCLMYEAELVVEYAHHVSFKVYLSY